MAAIDAIFARYNAVTMPWVGSKTINAIVRAEQLREEIQHACADVCTHDQRLRDL